MVQRSRRFCRLRARAWDGEQGLGLVEVMVAVMVLTIAVLALASGAVQSLASLGESRQRQQGTIAATKSIETVRSYPYDRIALQNNGNPVIRGAAVAEAAPDTPGSPLPDNTVSGNVHITYNGDLSVPLSGYVRITAWNEL